MNKKLNSVKEKFKNLKHKTLFKAVLISVLVLSLVVSVTVAWYINNTELWGVEFNTGNIDFITYVYDADGRILTEPISSDKEEGSSYTNTPLLTIDNAEIGTTGTNYIAVKSTGSIGIQYRIAFNITGVAGENDNGITYLGGYKYNISKVTDKVVFNGGDTLNVSGSPKPERIASEMVTIDKNSVNGTLEKEGYDVYRIDYTLVQKNVEYTGNGINIFFNVFATQIDGDFDDASERGYTYYCSTKEDIDRACVEAYPGDIIKLSSNIIYYGDLVFNKPISIETNDFTLTVNGNLIYDYVLSNGLKIDVGGLGKIIVQCTKEGVGGNFQIKTPISDVVLVGSNASTGDIVVENKMVIDATNSFGSAGVSFNEVRIADLNNVRKAVQLDSNTRATISFGTTVGLIQSVAKANNIEIVNNGEIVDINLSNMALLAQTNSPQIYILNNNDIDNPIMLPSWSEKFQKDENGNYIGNTRIVQSYAGSPTHVTGNCKFVDSDIEVEKKDSIVEQIKEGNDSRLRIYYQDINGQSTTIKSILANYLKNEATTGCAVNEVMELEIISIGNKAVTNADISFMNSNEMLSLTVLNLEQANVYDQGADTLHKLPNSAFSGVSKYESLILPQNLVEIGNNAFLDSAIDSVVIIPSGVTTFGANWFKNGKYVQFAASVPVAQAHGGLANAKAIFVEEAYIESYKSVYSSHAAKIYPVSVMDETKSHFVRNTQKDEWEITYYIKGEDAVIGENITIEGATLKITSVYDNAYRHNFTGANVKFADTVANLGAGNFYNNKNIVEVDLNNIRRIGNNVFYSASGLSHVSFGDSLESIGANAFYNCASLTQDVVLPDTMQTIGAAAFQRSQITSVNTGGATTIYGFTFASCPNLLYAELPNVKYIGEGDNNRVFDSCSLLVCVKMPSVVKISGTLIFWKCVSLRELYMGAKDDGISLGIEPFSGCDKTKIKLYVPEENLEFYQGKRPGNINATMIYPQGEKMGEELVNGFNIGTYIVSDNGNNSYSLITSNIHYSGVLEIPEIFNGKPITHIYANAFRNQNFTDVTLKLGDTVNSIGAHAFYQRNGLVEVDFGNSLKSIGEYAFASCVNLAQHIVLPDSMERIGGYAFNASGILSVDTGGTTTVEGYAFFSCASLTYAKMPEVTTAGENSGGYVFWNCYVLTAVDAPKLTTVYGAGMFYNCRSLREMHMCSDNAAVSLGTQPFGGIAKLQMKLFVPEDLVSFYQGKNIINKSMVYPEGEKIGDKAVNGYILGDYIVIPNENGYTLVTSNLDFTGDVAVPAEYNNRPITAIYANAFRHQTFTDVNLTLGNNVTTIGDGAFYGIAGLKSVNLDSVTTIEANAFYGCGIQILNAPKLTSVGDNAFRKCANLETVSLPKIETIGASYVFGECTNLKYVYFENIKAVNGQTFNLDNALEKITINREINSNGDNMPSKMTISSAAPCKIYVPYRSLAAYTDTWSGKPVVTFDISATHNGDTYILSDNNGKYMLIDFIPGQAITDLVLPNSLSAPEIGSISIHTIANETFSAVTETLKSLTLSSTVAQLGDLALTECVALENIYVSNESVSFTSINGVLYTKDGKLLVRYPMGRSGGFDMSGAEYSSTVGICAYAFANATNLTEIVFPGSLMMIDSMAFTNCTQLNRVEFTGNTPPSLMGAGIFDTSVDNFTMVVPDSAATAYQSAYNFAEYEPYFD